ncbi:DNA damage-inducible protein D, partial [Candidatus Saccharibacteria bacterium]|nr:DNA damage-inducible protein D [Candidatus Saccharibacteria bacterium]
MDNHDLIIFEQIKHSDDKIDEFWSARELYKALGYSRWEGFLVVIEKAKTSFSNSEFTKNYDINDHFRQVVKMVPTGSGAERPIDDYQLSKYACYLIAQNGDSR